MISYFFSIFVLVIICVVKQTHRCMLMVAVTAPSLFDYHFIDDLSFWRCLYCHHTRTHTHTHTRTHTHQREPWQQMLSVNPNTCSLSPGEDRVTTNHRETQEEWDYHLRHTCILLIVGVCCHKQMYTSRVTTERHWIWVYRHNYY
jgi:mRNA degradation ribonuclease J1/J2